MGIFKRRPKNQPKYLEEDLSSLSKQYGALDEALSRELEIGSRDIKKTTFSGDDRTFEVYSLNGVIKSVVEPAANLRLADRVYWEVTTDEDTRANLGFMEEKSNDADAYRFLEFVDDFPYQADFLTDVFRNMSIAKAIELNEYMGRTRVTVLTEAIMSDRLANVVEGWNFLDQPIAEFADTYQKEEAERAVEEGKLRIDQVDTSEVSLHLLDPSYVETSPEEKFVLFAAEADASWADLYPKSYGLCLSDIYQALQKLSHEGVLRVDGVPEIVEEELPTLAPEPVETLSTLDELEAESASDQTVLELDEDDLYVAEDESEEWTFDETTADSEMPRFTPTPMVFDSLTEAIEDLLAKYDVEEEDAARVKGHLVANATLESEVLQVESELEPLTVEYAEGVTNYDELKFEAAVEDLQNDDEDPAEAERETVDSRPEMRSYRRNSNSKFFVLEALEGKRHRLNQLRKKELYGLMARVPFEGDDQESIAVQDRIEAKLAGIEAVRNVAFFPGTAQEDPMVLKARARNMRSVGRHAIETFEPEPNSLALAYYALVQELGFDPVLAYQREIAARQEAYDELGNGRTAEMEPAMAEAYERLQVELISLDAEDGFEEALASGDPNYREVREPVESVFAEDGETDGVSVDTEE